jgi:hypothetical protein
MALQLSDIQALAQFYADESTLSLSSAANLPVINAMYRQFCADWRFPEIEVTDTSITLVAGQESYIWPSKYKFRTEPTVTLQRTVGNPRLFVKVTPIQDNIYWSFLKNVNQSFPSHYKKESQDGQNYNILFRPVSNISGLQLYIIGQIEPKPFVQATDWAIWKEDGPATAFAIFIASQFQAKRNNPGRADELLDDMRDLLPESIYGPTPQPNLAVPWFT